MKRKALLISVLAVSMALGYTVLSSRHAQAYPTFNAKVSYSTSAYLTLYGQTSSGWQTNYQLVTDSPLYSTLDAFCVENANVSSSSEEYELVPATVFSEHDFYQGLLLATWVADQYWNHPTTWVKNKKETQIAIWELVFDYKLGAFNNNNLRLDMGNLILHGNADADLIEDILEDAVSNGYYSSSVSIANSPPGTYSTENFQNYLVNVPVPEPGTFALVGIGLLGLGFYGRRRMKRNS